MPSPARCHRARAIVDLGAGPGSDTALLAARGLRAFGILRPRDVLSISVKAGSGTVTETTRYGLPRFFQFWTDAELDAALEAHAFEVLTRSTDLGAHDAWLTRLARRD